jgi:hypothetical protein
MATDRGTGAASSPAYASSRSDNPHSHETLPHAEIVARNVFFELPFHVASWLPDHA